MNNILDLEESGVGINKISPNRRELQYVPDKTFQINETVSTTGIFSIFNQMLLCLSYKNILSISESEDTSVSFNQSSIISSSRIENEGK